MLLRRVSHRIAASAIHVIAFTTDAVASDNTYASSTISKQLLAIGTLTILGAAAYIAFPLLALLIYYLLIELVISIITADNHDTFELWIKRKVMV